MTNHERAWVLYQQRRYDQAEKELRLVLAEDPQDARSHALLAGALVAQDQVDNAMVEAKEAVGLDPTCDLGFFIMSLVHMEKGRFKESKQALDEAIQIDPNYAPYYAHAANLALLQQKWQDARTWAETGLTHDPEDIDCINALARAQLQIGDIEQSAGSLERALELDPENAYTHCNMGWLLVRRNQPEKAIEHLKESLRIDPNFELARECIAEALKARSPVYYMILKGNLWLMEMPVKVRIAILVAWFLIKPLRLILLIFILLMWFGGHIFTLMLRLDPLGRKVLTDKDKQTNNIALIAMVAISAALYWLLSR